MPLMSHPNDRKTYDIPLEGVPAMRALGWEIIEPAHHSTPTVKPKGRPGRKRVPKPGDDK